jgi:hypothetical protein
MMGETPPCAGVRLSPARLADGFVPPGETPETLSTTFTTSGDRCVVVNRSNKWRISASYSFRTTFTTFTTAPLADAHAHARARAARGSSVVNVVNVVDHKYIYIYQSLIERLGYYAPTTFGAWRSIAGAGRPGGASRSLELEPGRSRLGARLRAGAADRVARVPIRQRIDRPGCRRFRSAAAMGRGGAVTSETEYYRTEPNGGFPPVFRAWRGAFSDVTAGASAAPAAPCLAAARPPRRGRADRVPSGAGGSTVPGKKFGKKWEGRPRAGESSHGEDQHQL